MEAAALTQSKTTRWHLGSSLIKKCHFSIFILNKRPVIQVYKVHVHNYGVRDQAVKGNAFSIKIYFFLNKWAHERDQIDRPLLKIA